MLVVEPLLNLYMSLVNDGLVGDELRPNCIFFVEMNRPKGSAYNDEY